MKYHLLSTQNHQLSINFEEVKEENAILKDK